MILISPLEDCLVLYASVGLNSPIQVGQVWPSHKHIEAVVEWQHINPQRSMINALFTCGPELLGSCKMYHTYCACRCYLYITHIYIYIHYITHVYTCNIYIYIIYMCVHMCAWYISETCCTFLPLLWVSSDHLLRQNSGPGPVDLPLPSFFFDLSGIMGNPGKTCPPKGHVEKIVIEGLPFVFRLVRVLFEKAWKHLGLNYARGVNLQQLDIDKNINQNSS